MTRELCCHLELIYSFKKLQITGGKETSPKAADSDRLPVGVLQQFAIVPIALHRTHLFQVRVRASPTVVRLKRVAALFLYILHMLYLLHNVLEK